MVDPDDKVPATAVREQEDTESVSAKAKETGRRLKDLIDTVAAKVESTAKEKTVELKENAEHPQTYTNERTAISDLCSLLNHLTANFDDTMEEIGKAPYTEQKGMLVGYKKVLAEELNVIDARLGLVKRLAPLPVSAAVVDTDAV